MIARTRTPLGRRLAWLVLVGLSMTALLAPGAAPALAASVAPIPISNNSSPTCADFDGTFGGGQTWLEAKQDPPGNGTITVAGFGTITVSNFVQSASGVPGSFNWSSTFGIDAVLVKAGSDKHNLYVYAASAGAAESTGDTGLEPQAGSGNGISHISFCYDAGAPPTPTPTTAPTPTPTLAPTPTPTLPPPPTATPTGGVGGATGTPAPTGGVGGATADPTLPSTSTIDQTGSGPTGDGWRLIILAMAGLLAGALLLTPARAVIRKDDDTR
jgi:hypothetical protein